MVDLADSKFSYRAEIVDFSGFSERKGRLFCVCTPDFFASLNTFRYFCKNSLNPVSAPPETLKALIGLVERDLLIFDWLDFLARFAPILFVNVYGP